MEAKELGKLKAASWSPSLVIAASSAWAQETPDGQPAGPTLTPDLAGHSFFFRPDGGKDAEATDASGKTMTCAPKRSINLGVASGHGDGNDRLNSSANISFSSRFANDFVKTFSKEPIAFPTCGFHGRPRANKRGWR